MNISHPVMHEGDRSAPGFRDVWQTLQRLGLASVTIPEPADAVAPGIDWVPWLRAHHSDSNPGVRGQALRDRLDRLADEKAGVYWGWPDARCDFQKAVYSSCLLIGHRDLFGKQFRSIVSSRIGRALEDFRAGFDALRTSLFEADSTASWLLGDGTSTAPYVGRLAALLNRDLVRLTVMPVSVAKKILFLNSRMGPQKERSQTVWALPVGQAARPQIDRLTVAASREVRVLRVTRRGNTYRALRSALTDSARGCRRIMICSSFVTGSPAAAELIDRGAIPWWLYRMNAIEPRRNDRSKPSLNSLPPILSVGQLDVSEFMAHFTRGQHHPAPRQTQSEFIDGLLFDENSIGTRALGSLCRILNRRRVLGTHRVSRSAQPVVCFTSVPLTDFGQRRVYRPHLGRWDFEPFGIAVRDGYLKSLGLRAVSYGDQQAWEDLDVAARPFFQLQRSGRIDWRSEQEYRLCGDLDLRPVGRDDAVVFVPDRASALTVAPLSRWAVVVLNR